jgi:hypothetical protein
MKPHYFNQDKPDEDDKLLVACIKQGYVPDGCLLQGQLVFSIITHSGDPCNGCAGPRKKCKGRPEK